MIRKLFTLLTAVMTSATTWAQSTSDIGKVLAADGKMYKTVAAATNAGTTASGIIAYWGAAGSVESGNSSYRGMAIALEDASLSWGEQPNHTNYCSSDNHQCSSATSYCNTIWDALNAINGIAATTSAQERNGSGHWHNAPLNGYDVTRPSGSSIWAIPSVGQWKLMAQGLTGKSSNLSETDNPDYTYDKLSAKITAAGGNTLRWLFYWSSTEVSASNAYIFDIGGINSNRNGSRVRSYAKNTDNEYTHVRMFFAFSSATAAVYTISYNANGGSGAPSNQTKDGGIDLTLSSTVPTRTGYAFAGWNTQADGSGTSYASGATFTGNANTTLYAQWTFQGSGIENDPYLIPSEDVWNYLADQVNGGTNYSGKYFQQTGDFTVSSKIIGHPTDDTHYVTFNGIYDGNGCTITASISKSDERYVAPFHCIANATIKNVILTGSVTVSGSASIEHRRHPAGLVGVTDGTCILQNCRVSANVSGCDYMGGLIGHTQAANITITGCVYSGTLTASDTNNTGGLIGWGGDNGGKTYTLTNNLFAGSYSGSGKFHPVGFLYNPTGNTRTVTNTYYMTGLRNVGDNDNNCLVKGLVNKGKFAYSITTGKDVTLSGLSSTTATYDVSGITAYSHGIKYNDIYYAGDGDAVTLNLSHADKAGYTFNQYTVTGGGSLGNPTTNTPTLTMTDANQTINAEWLENTATLSQATDNSSFISTNNGLVYDITLGRTMNAGGWNTFCVPFDISSEMIASVFGSGTEVRELGSSVFDEGTKALTLNFAEATSIQAGKPYLVYLGSGLNVVNPTFEDVTIVSGTTTTETTYANFMPVMNPTSLTGGDKSILFVTGGNKLTYPNTNNSMKGFRAYFQLLGDAASGAREFVMDFGDGEVTGIINSQLSIVNSSDTGMCYDLQGRRVQNPAKGLYIVNGKKVVIK